MIFRICKRSGRLDTGGLSETQLQEFVNEGIIARGEAGNGVKYYANLATFSVTPNPTLCTLFNQDYPGIWPNGQLNCTIYDMFSTNELDRHGLREWHDMEYSGK